MHHYTVMILHQHIPLHCDVIILRRHHGLPGIIYTLSGIIYQALYIPPGIVILYTYCEGVTDYQGNYIAWPKVEAHRPSARLPYSCRVLLLLL